MLVLAVDDDKDDLELFCEAVKDIDPSINLITAVNGDEALDFLFNKAVTYPSYVFLDINLPRLDGRGCLTQIRENKLTKHLPVIMYSTSLSDQDKLLFEQLHARFLTKASSYRQLMDSLKEILGRLTKENSEPISFKDL